MYGNGDRNVDKGTIEAARNGDRLAKEVLVSALQGPWYRMCLSLLRDAELSRDATQETALRFLRLLPQFRGESSITTWSMGIAINVVREMRRKRRPESGEVPDVAGDLTGPEGVATQKEQNKALHAAMAGLSERQREAIVCRYFEELSTEETAKIMNCAPGTVKATLHQALRALKGKIKQFAGNE
jgi:RNA polymerase sigma-70 factor (ECF subfamily)